MNGLVLLGMLFLILVELNYRMRKCFADRDKNVINFNVVVGITIAMVLFFVCLSAIVDIFKKENLEQILNHSLAVENCVPCKNVYYVVDSKTHTITIISSPKIIN